MIINIVESLRSPSHDVRYLAIQVIIFIYQAMRLEVPKLITDCKLIDEIPLDVSNARNFGLYIRNLSNSYAGTGADTLLDLIIPRFFFGLLTAKFQPIWEASVEAISKISEKNGEIIWSLAYEWIVYEPKISPVFGMFDDIILDEPEQSATVECSNLSQVINHSVSSFYKYSNSQNFSKLSIRDSLDKIDFPPTVRGQIIKVLASIPRVAEKHSRLLVPFLLWDINSDDGEDSEETETPLSSTWSVKDRIALLDLFSLFGNPKTLYKSEEVYERYLYLLGNRSLAVQKIALKCLLTFKNPQIRKYRDNLEGMLDDTQFKDELTNLVRYSGEEGTIHEDDRAALLPIVIRIIFGRAQIAKTGGVKQGRRFAVVNSLSNVEPEYLRLFIDLSANRLEHEGFLKGSYDGVLTINPEFSHFQSSDLRLRRELGFVTMLEEILEQLGDRVHVAWDIIIESLILCLYRANQAHTDLNEQDEDEPTDSVIGKNIRSIRQLGFKCLNALFSILPGSNWAGCFDIIYSNFISNRMAKFAEENLQQPSSLMRIFVTLSSEKSLVRFLTWDNCAIIKSFFACLSYDEVKDSVVDVIMDTMNNILELERSEDTETLSVTGVPIVLNRMPYLFERQSNHQLLEKEAQLLVKLMTSGYEASDDIRKQLIEVSLAALEKNTTLVRVSVKVSVLQTLSVLLMDGRSTLEECTSAYYTLSKLFRQFTNRQARENLAAVFDVFGDQFDVFKTVSKLVVDLNSYSAKRLDLPDFDRRLSAFAVINETKFDKLTAMEWLPLLYNMLFFMKDPEELALRTNATYSVKRFIDGLASRTNEEDVSSYVQLLDDVVIPVVKTSLRDSNDIFRTQFIDVLGHIVKAAKWYSKMNDMKCLLFDGDEEANFFNNINHLQIHRRRRAVRRLSKLASKGSLTDTNIAHYILPIIEHFVGGTEGDAHNLSEDSIKCIGVLARHLTWNQYRAITKRYIAYLNSRPESIKATVKLVETASDALISPVDETDMDLSLLEEDEDEDTTMAGSEDISPAVVNSVEGAVKLADCLPSVERLSAFITEDIVPTMQKVLNKKNDDDTLTLRIPLALPIVKFIKALPEALIELKLPGVLTGLCQILRAKSQELRDMIRSTLGRIARILGTKYLVFIIKELKGALRRGAQLHILGYSLHSLLSELKDIILPRDLDVSATLIMDIIMEDTFGVTGGEKDEEGYTSDMKEVKQYKSYDSGQILASNVGLGTFSELVEPVKTLLLYEKLNLKMEKKVEELLRRFALGLYHNIDASKQEVLVMCFELYEMVNNVSTEIEKKKKIDSESHIRDEQKREAEEHFMIQLDSRHWGEQNTIRIGNLHIITKFVIEMIRTVLGKNEHMMTAENVAGFMPMLDEGLNGNYEDVQIASLRLLAHIIKLPIPDVSGRVVSLGRRTLWLIKSSTSTNTELCQACLRFISVCIRQKKDFSLKEKELAYCLNRLKPDIEEPDRQGITLTFIRAVLSRQIMMPEVYDIMDQVAQVMVTNQSNVTREACRSAYFQFLTEYPQGKGRLTKQLKFLVANLEYPAVSGRLSVMEIIHLLLAKVTDDQVQEVIASFFVALVLVLINDEESQCRETAAALIGELLDISKDEQLSLIEKYCTTWLTNRENELLLRGGFQVTGIYCAKFGVRKNPKLFKLAISVLEKLLEDAKSDSNVVVQWETLYQGLQFVAKTVQNSNGLKILFSSNYQQLWDLIESSLLFPHAWVRLASSRLIGKLYSVYSGGKNCEITISTDGLQSTAFKFVRQLGAASISEDLGIQIVKNLVFISMQWEKSEETIYFVKPRSSNEDEDEDDDTATEERIPVIRWLIQKISSVLRAEKNFKEMIVSKKASIQLLASIIQLLSVEKLSEMAEDIIMAFYIYSISEEDRTRDLKELCLEALNMVQKKLGTTKYVQAYSNVQQQVSERRLERKSKRAIQSVSAPDVYARKKLRKNLAKREKRKHSKDENGYYHSKKSKNA
ncbi:Utp20p [Sugiyamaella lignohabitans]|uniref:Utp20p n=1 Tax=Sugiyamaella lignohabitans TaxID=796027 RepID=A0A167C009_9ASCO|nr:Utp20p [Sugiyamaella lignohabitans]ANB11042.1 Utp20p [Sugiyamaella lignohabitans]